VTRNLPLCIYDDDYCAYYLDGLCEIEDVEDCPVKDDWEDDDEEVGDYYHRAVDFVDETSRPWWGDTERDDWMWV